MRYGGGGWGWGWLAVGSLFGGCDVLWAPYVVNYVAADLGPTSLCDPTDPTLVLCLPFEGQVTDSSRNQIALTGGPVPGYVRGVVGQAAHFDDKTPSVLVGDHPAWNVSEFTFEAWVRPDELPTGKFNRFGLMDREGAYSAFLYTNVGENDLALSCTTNDAAVQGLKIPLGTFSHVACTFKSGEQVLYLNGQPGPTDVLPVKTPAPGPLQQYLGSNVPSGGKPDPDALVGALDELRFFSQSRTAAQIQAAYARGAPSR